MHGDAYKPLAARDEAKLSPHLQQRRQGYRWLRFTGPLEGEFRQWYWQINEGRVRFCLLASGLIFGLFAIKDLLALPAHVSQITASLRLVVVMGAIGIAYATIRLTQQQHLREAALLAAGIASLSGMALAIIASLLLGYPLPYEGLLLIIFSLYFLIGLRTWRAFWTCLLICVCIQAAWRITTLEVGEIRLRGYYLFSAVIIGLLGAYALEYQARGHFLALRIAQFRGNTDMLTGLPSRRAILAHLERVLRQARRDDQPIGVFLIDVDHFKLYNDTYTHIEGDRCLKAVADACASALHRPLDAVGRFGGEEFLAVAHNAGPTHAALLGERICEAVHALNMDHAHGVDGKVSVSVGGYSLPAANLADTSSLLRHADEALYEAKRQGRGRFCYASGTPAARTSAPPHATATP